MNPLYAIAAASLAGLAAMTALPANFDATCQAVDGVGFVCVDADADCTDGSCGATVDGEVGVPASRANADVTCQTVDGVGFVCVDADADCTDGSCGATVDGEVGVPQATASRANCADAPDVGTVCADAGENGAQVDVTYNVQGVASGEAHAGVGIGRLT